MKKNFISAGVFFVLTTFAFWLFGYDFNERGVMAVTWFVVSTLIAALGFIFAELLTEIRRGS